MAPDRVWNASVIVTLLNEEKSVDALISSLLEQEMKPQEIVVVDGGSKDKTVEKLKKWKKEAKKKGIELRIYVEEGNIAHGRNFAIKKARNEIIAITDGGCIAHRSWLKELVETMKKSNADVVCGNFVPFSTNFAERVQAVFVKPSARDNPNPRSMLIKKKAWEKVGGFPEDLYTGEDTAFNLELKKAGFKFAFAEKAIVLWKPRKSFLKWLKQYFLYGKGDGKALHVGIRGYGAKVTATIILSYLFLFLLFKSPQLFILASFPFIFWGIAREPSIFGFVAGALFPLRILAYSLGFHLGLVERVMK